MKRLSLIIPVYFEEECIAQFLLETKPILESTDYEWEIVFIDDGSTDKTVEILKEHALNEKRIKIIEFSYNQGKQAAVSAGIKFASGDLL